MKKAWILPTGNVGALVVLGMVILYAGASQGNNAAYILGFLIFSATLLSILHGWLNLSPVTLRVDAVRPVFVGEDLLIPVELFNPSRKACHGIRVRLAARGAREQMAELPPGGTWRGRLVLPATRRGRVAIPRIRVASSFPLGFFEAVRRVEAEQETIVYPEPAGVSALPFEGAGASGDNATRIHDSGDDFAGMRAYRPGESQRRVDWKAVARGAPLLVKEFGGMQQEDLMLDLENAGAGGVEERLSQLTLWALRAEGEALRYGLRLNTERVAVGSGEPHLRAVLRLLALHENPLERSDG